MVPGQKLALTVNAFYQNLFYLSNRFDQVNIGASVGLRKPIGQNAYLEGTYTLQNVEIDVDTNGNATQLLVDENGDYLQSKVELNFVHDTRDSVFITRKGHKFEAGLMASGLGGDVETYGGNIGGQQFFHLPGDTILSFDGMARWVDGWGNDRVPIFDRLFLGGAYNLRGYDYRDVGPKEKFCRRTPRW